MPKKDGVWKKFSFDKSVVDKIKKHFNYRSLVLS